MAKYETVVRGNPAEFIEYFQQALMHGSISASYEDGSDWQSGNITAAVRVFERYSWFGNNRTTLTLTVIGENQNFQVSLITSGGSQAVFFKINTVGENSFLNTAVEIINRYQNHAG